MARVLLLGADGLLGRSLSAVLAVDHQLIRQSRRAADGVDAVADPVEPGDARALLVRTKPDVIVNTIALTNVDQCQREPQAAFIANARVAESLASALAGTGTRLIHVSTDHVYTRPFAQSEDQVDVLNMYAATKLLGEAYALRHPHSLVLRTNFAGHSSSPARASFSDWIVDSLRARTRIRLARDLLFNPLSLDSLSRILARLVTTPASGLYNLGSIGATSKHEAGVSIARHLGLDTALIDCVEAADLGFATLRPTDMTMDVSRFQRDCFPLPSTATEIETIAHSHEHAR